MHQIIAGMGFVGEAVYKLFPDAIRYDISYHDNIKKAVLADKYDFAHVCVSTPPNPDGSCNTESVEDAINKITADVYIIRSTIPPGTTEMLMRMTQKNIVFQPEYCASSSPYPAPLADLRKHPFIILGGCYEATKKARKLYEKVYPPTCQIFESDSTTAEVIKYIENAFIATKVTFCNEAYRIGQRFGVDYDRVREGVFRLDPRMNEWWTYCEGKGWGGHCLPKDMAAIIKACQDMGYEPGFLKAVVENNERHKEVGNEEK